LAISKEKCTFADEESVEIYKQAKALAKKENISFKDALLKIKEI
jgi:predicted nucleic acid-binding protein